MADIAGFVEHYAHANPSSVLAKLRQFCEQIVEHVYAKHGLSKPFQSGLNDLLQEYSFGVNVKCRTSSKSCSRSIMYSVVTAS